MYNSRETNDTSNLFIYCNKIVQDDANCKKNLKGSVWNVIVPVRFNLCSQLMSEWLNCDGYRFHRSFNISLEAIQTGINL